MQKMFIIEPTDILRLLTHYTDGGVPLDAEAKRVGVNPYLTRFIGIECESDEWDNFSPLHIRYEGKKVLGWTNGGGDPVWKETPDTPNRQ